MPQRAAERIAGAVMQPPVRGLPGQVPLIQPGLASARADSLRAELKQLMTANVGILRTLAGMEEARDRLDRISAECEAALRKAEPAWAWFELRDLAQVAAAIARSALEQRANAGAHWCEDLAARPIAPGRQGSSAAADRT